MVSEAVPFTSKSGRGKPIPIPQPVEILEQRVLLSGTNGGPICDCEAEECHDQQHALLKGGLTGTEADESATGRVKYRTQGEEKRLEVKIEDLTSVEAGETVEVFINGASVGTIIIEEMQDGSHGRRRKLDSNDGDTVSTEIESGDEVEIRTTDTVLLSGRRGLRCRVSDAREASAAACVCLTPET